MVLLFDMNNLALRCIFASHIKDEPNDIKYEMWEYTMFESIFYSMKKFWRADEVVLAVDSTSWRKEYFKPYKANRKTKREDDTFDWDDFFRRYALYIEELKVLPFNVLKIPRAEGDDIIGALALESKKPVTIVSVDRDFKQLYRKNQIEIFEPIKKEFFKCDNTEEFLYHEILNGQTKDNVFNVFTPDDWPEDKKKPRFGDKKALKIIENGLDDWLNAQDETVKKHFERNKQLLDLRLVPDDVKALIKESYHNYQLPDPEGFYKFFKSKGWRGILENYDDVEKTLLRLY